MEQEKFTGKAHSDLPEVARCSDPGIALDMEAKQIFLVSVLRVSCHRVISPLRLFVSNHIRLLLLSFSFRSD